MFKNESIIIESCVSPQTQIKIAKSLLLALDIKEESFVKTEISHGYTKSNKKAAEESCKTHGIAHPWPEVIHTWIDNYYNESQDWAKHTLKKLTNS